MEIIAALNYLAGEVNATRDKQEASDSKNNLREWVGAIGIYLAACVAIGAISIASRDAHEQVTALIDQVKAMNEQVKEAKDQRLLLTEQTRANLRREAPKITPLAQVQADGSQKVVKWSISPAWTNTGGTSAKEVRAWFDVKPFDFTFDAEFIKAGKCPEAIASNPLPTSSVVFPGSPINL